MTGPLAPARPEPEDPHLWLEDVEGERALAWVRERSKETLQAFAGDAEFQELQTRLLEILDADARIPYVRKQGVHLYNFWRDLRNPRGLWRRTTLAEYRKDSPRWELVLDLDALARAENENWVFQGAEFLKPGHHRCLIALSRGGADAAVTREFDLKDKRFVTDGFQLPETKGEISWINQDTVFVAADFGPGSLTSSGYPRVAKIWRRGTPLSQARTVFEGRDGDVAVSAAHDATRGFERDLIIRAPGFYSNEVHLLGRDGQLRQLDKPDDATASFHREWLLLELRSAWTVDGVSHPGGALLAIRAKDFLAGKRQFTTLFAPTASTALSGFAWTRHHLILNLLDDVTNRLEVCTPHKEGWEVQPFQGAPALGSLTVAALDPERSDDFFMTVTDFLTPTSLHLGTVGQPPVKLKETPAFFDATGLEIRQHFTASQDGTRIPYFQVGRRERAGAEQRPTLLVGYGGFEVANLPAYSGIVGHAWLSQGGTYVVANIRGGGEYGPSWHQAALKANRPRAFEDFAAVARDLCARGVTTPARLGILGGSNGGLLVGNMLTRYPELFGAIVCQVPLLDMKRYSHLLAGASWMAEYGDPDRPEEWAFIQGFSPYHQVRAGVAYPPVLFMTSTRDDRVHPGHARKMMARISEVTGTAHYFENTEGGHGGAADNPQTARMWALAYRYLWKTLKIQE